MYSVKTAISEYEYVLLGKSKTFPTFFFCESNSTYNQRLALDIFRYAIEEVLHWDPSTAASSFDYATIKKLKLDSIMKYIIFPAELDPKQDTFYIVSLIYQDEIKYRERDAIISIYENILKGKQCKFPKEYLNGSKGRVRACVCLQHVLGQYLSFSSVEEMYELFSENKINSTLRKFRLISICNDLFEDPLDFLHAALPKKQKNDYYYHFYKFQRYNKLVAGDIKKSREKERIEEKKKKKECKKSE